MTAAADARPRRGLFGGRPGEMVGACESGCVGGTRIEGIALGDDGRELARHRERTPTAYDDVLKAITGVVARLEASVPRAATRATVGVGTPGVLHPSRGVMLNSNRASLNDRPLDAI